jgi:uncharacterized protein (TIGR00725 family)
MREAKGAEVGYSAPSDSDGDEDRRAMLLLDRTRGRLCDGRGRCFDPEARNWRALEGAVSGDPVDPVEAVAWLQRDSGRPCRVPVGVIGGRSAGARQMETAEAVGAGLAALGLTVLCGGREGVMEAVCRGAARAGGLTVGLLPDDDWRAANRHVRVPIATGISVARNAVIARAALALIAIGVRAAGLRPGRRAADRGRRHVGRLAVRGSGALPAGARALDDGGPR